MRRPVRWLTAASVAAVLLGPSARGGPGADNPHAYMEEEARCAGCHHVEKEGDDWVLDPHVFRLSATDLCRMCHPREQMGRSHPVGADPLKALKLKRMPPGLPLQEVEGQRGEFMTCGTCHNPHLPRFSSQRLYSRQSSAPGRSGEFFTYFLRVKPKETREGFASLCNACHPKF